LFAALAEDAALQILARSITKHARAYMCHQTPFLYPWTDQAPQHHAP
jgi:hypothetical protein